MGKNYPNNCGFNSNPKNDHFDNVESFYDTQAKILLNQNSNFINFDFDQLKVNPKQFNTNKDRKEVISDILSNCNLKKDDYDLVIFEADSMDVGCSPACALREPQNRYIFAGNLLTEDPYILSDGTKNVGSTFLHEINHFFGAIDKYYGIGSAYQWDGNLQGRNSALRNENPSLVVVRADIGWTDLDSNGKLDIFDASLVGQSPTPVKSPTSMPSPSPINQIGDGGLAKQAKLNNPYDITIDKQGNIYIADTYNQRIRKVDILTGIITTIAGTGMQGYYGDGGNAILAKILLPSGLIIDSIGNIYIADSGNNRVRMLGVPKSYSRGPADISAAVITLERTACFGQCPVYKLTIYGDGRVAYNGIKYVSVAGTQTAQISQSKVKEFVDEFYRVNYFSFKDSYESHMITDAPSAITSITVDGKMKTVRHYQGDTNAPKDLGDLENKIDEIANSKIWVKQQK